MLGVFCICWFATLVKDSRHAGSVLCLLVCYLSEGFKACWECFVSAGLLPSDGFKACWKCFVSAGLLP